MYTAKGQLDASALLKQYSPLVRRLAHQMIAKLPANVELDDLIQVGMIGLSDALSRFDAAQGVQFETFATQLRLEAGARADDAPVLPGWPMQAPSRSAMNLN